MTREILNLLIVFATDISLAMVKTVKKKILPNVHAEAMDAMPEPDEAAGLWRNRRRHDFETPGWATWPCCKTFTKPEAAAPNVPFPDLRGITDSLRHQAS